MDELPIKSPCILLCAIERNSGHCYGCGRTREEITNWLNYSHAERDALMETLPARVAEVERNRPPRRERKRRTDRVRYTSFKDMPK